MRVKNKNEVFSKILMFNRTQKRTTTRLHKTMSV